MGRRLLLVIAGWLGAAMLALLVGLAAINVIGAGLTSSGDATVSQADVARELAEGSAAPSGAAAIGDRPVPTTTSPVAPPAGSVTPAPTTFFTRAGTVTVRCSGSLVEIVSMSPVQGFAVHEWERGRQDDAEAEFRGAADNHDRVKVEVECRSGAPVIEPDSGGDD